MSQCNCGAKPPMTCAPTCASMNVPTIVRYASVSREFFDKLPKDIQDLAHMITVREIVRRQKAKKLEEITAQLSAARAELQEYIHETEIAQSELSERINTYVKENNR